MLNIQAEGQHVEHQVDKIPKEQVELGLVLVKVVVVQESSVWYK